MLKNKTLLFFSFSWVRKWREESSKNYALFPKGNSNFDEGEKEKKRPGSMNLCLPNFGNDQF
ncbi:hypothetical protein, partial [Proteus mirabilis]|uniref:hypothetical protein n=1 Tax=Proteus mirabilis TaxID=584 RepID=UPI001C13011A